MATEYKKVKDKNLTVSLAQSSLSLERSTSSAVQKEAAKKQNFVKIRAKLFTYGATWSVNDFFLECFLSDCFHHSPLEWKPSKKFLCTLVPPLPQ